MSGVPGRSGGARAGSGPVRRRITLSPHAAALLRDLTRRRVGRRDVSTDDLVTTIESLIIAADQRETSSKTDA